jgi:ribosomal protein S14
VKEGKKVRTCANCGQEEWQQIPALGHAFGPWEEISAPTFTKAGKRSRQCEVCGYTEEKEMKANGHQWSDWTVIKEATTEEEGSQTRSCQVCGEEETEIIPVIKLSKEEKRALAMEVAQEIADLILAETEGASDLERVYLAAYVVCAFCEQCVYTTEGEDYSQAYGVFIKGEFSCAGSTRALGMVLECMGYEWFHVNENQWTHQWCMVEMDGQIGWADGMIGMAGYGEHAYVQSLGSNIARGEKYEKVHCLHFDCAALPVRMRQRSMYSSLGACFL